MGILELAGFWTFVWVCVILYGLNRGWRAVKKAHAKRVEDRKAKRAAKKAAKPDIPGPVLFAMQAAEWAAMLRHGWQPLRDGLIEGARVGWAVGQERAAKWGPPPPPDPEPEAEKTEPEQNTDANGDGSQTDQKPEPTREPVPATSNGRPRLDVIDGGAGTGGEEPMGEINNVTDLKIETEAAHNQAVADVDDIQAAIRRANNSITRVTAIIAAVNSPKIKMPPNDKKVFDAMADPFADVKKKLEAAKTALSDAQAAANAALGVAQKHVGLIGVAAGEPYKAG